MLCCKLEAADLLITLHLPFRISSSLSRKNWDVTITAKMFPEGA